VTQSIHAGLIAALREQVIPRLVADAPQLEATQLIPLKKPYRCFLGFEGGAGSATRRKRRSERSSNCHCISSPAARSIAAANGRGILI